MKSSNKGLNPYIGPMRVFTIIIIFFTAVTAAFSYTDESHYSETFERNRTFRVFTPLDYDRANTRKKYRVIYAAAVMKKVVRIPMPIMGWNP